MFYKPFEKNGSFYKEGVQQVEPTDFFPDKKRPTGRLANLFYTLSFDMPRGRIELPTREFSVRCSTG